MNGPEYRSVREWLDAVAASRCCPSWPTCEHYEDPPPDDPDRIQARIDELRRRVKVTHSESCGDCDGSGFFQWWTEEYGQEEAACPCLDAVCSFELCDECARETT